jgi:hypothetical protein
MIPTLRFTTEQIMPFNRLSGILRPEASPPSFASEGRGNRPSFVMLPFAVTQGPWQEIYRIAHEKAQAVVLPEPSLRFECWN